MVATSIISFSYISVNPVYVSVGGVLRAWDGTTWRALRLAPAITTVTSSSETAVPAETLTYVPVGSVPAPYQKSGLYGIDGITGPVLVSAYVEFSNRMSSARRRQFIELYDWRTGKSVARLPAAGEDRMTLTAPVPAGTVLGVNVYVGGAPSSCIMYVSLVEL